MSDFAPHTAPHLKAPRTVAEVMGLVLLALFPAALVQSWFFGAGFWIQWSLAVLTGVGCEALATALRGRSLRPVLTDGSTLVTASLLAFCMPPLAPWWLVVSAMAFAILLSKHLYGGLGMNPFNPAMVGYAVLLVSFPTHMTEWLPVRERWPQPLSFADTLHTIFTGQLPMSWSVDLLSAASPLSALSSGLALRRTLEEVFATPVFGEFADRGWEWLSLAFLAGGMLLLLLRVIRWHIPLSMLATIFICASVMHMLDPGRYAGPVFHLFSGATMIGAFFIATDPVTAASSPRGRLIYGAGIGLLTYLIRSFGHYHDGVAFAVLTMNLAAPLIDRFTIPRIYGEAR